MAYSVRRVRSSSLQDIRVCRELDPWLDVTPFYNPTERDKDSDDLQTHMDTTPASPHRASHGTPRSCRTLRKIPMLPLVQSRSRSPGPSRGEGSHHGSPSSEILYPMRSMLAANLPTSSLPRVDSPQSDSAMSSPNCKVLSLTLENSERVKAGTETGIGPFADFEERLEAPKGSILQENTAPAEPVAQNVVVVVVDAEKQFATSGLDWALLHVARTGDDVTVLGFLRNVMSPMGYKMVADVTKFTGVHESYLERFTLERKQALEKKLSTHIKACAGKGIKLQVRVVPGALPKAVIVREAVALNASWVVFERKVMKDRRFYIENLSCHAVRMKTDQRTTETICYPGQGSVDFSGSISMTSDTSSESSFSSKSDSPSIWKKLIGGSRRHLRSLSNSPQSSIASRSFEPRSASLAPTSSTASEDLPDISFSFDCPRDANDSLATTFKALYFDQSPINNPLDAAPSPGSEAFLQRQLDVLSQYSSHRTSAPTVMAT